MAEIRDFTGKLERAQAFLRAKCMLVRTDDLSIHIKHTRARGRDLTGYYRLEDRRIVIAVKQRLRYPRRAAYAVGSVTIARRSPRSRPFRLVWHEEEFRDADELLAFVAGHEMWHYLCHSGQRRADHETKANCLGFLWLREFKTWPGAGHAVEPIPERPPRPDLPADARAPAPVSPASTVAGAGRWVQQSLFQP